MKFFETKKLFQAEIENIPLIRNWIIEQIKIADKQLPFIDDLKSAISEALTNIALYAYSAEQSKPLTITVMLDAEKVTIIFQDKGTPADFRNYVPPDLENPKEGGYGIFLMHRLMDGIQYNFDDDGTTLVMWKSRIENEEK